MANPFDDFDAPSAGGVATAPAPSPSPAPAKPQANPFDSFDAPKNPFDAFDGPSPEALANDPNYSAEHAAIGHAQGSPEWEAAFAADQARQNRGVGAKVAEGAKTFLSPQPWIEGAKAVGNLFGGAVVTPFDTARENLASAGAGIADAVGADDASQYLGQTATRLKAENILAGQQNEENIRNVARIAKQHPVMTNIATAGTAGVVQPFIPPDDARTDFANRVEHARREQQLAGGTPLDTGAIAALARSTSSNKDKISDTYGPEGLKNIGTQVDPSAVAMKTAASDPMNLVLAGAPGLPGAATVGGRLTQGLGKLAQLPMAGAEAAGSALTHAGPIGRIAAAATGLGVSPHVVTAILAHPAGAAIVGGLALGAKGLQVLGRAAEAQGKEFATGIPSEFTTRAATAAATGVSDAKAGFMRGLGNATTQGVTTPLAMAPVNYAMAEGDPRKFAESEAGAATFGGALGAFTRNRPALVEAIRPHLQSEGARALAEAGEGNDPIAIKSAAYVMSQPPEARDRTLEAIGALQGLPTNTPNGPQRAKLYVLSDADYKDTIAQKFGMQQAAMGGGRGFYIGDDGAAYVNGDYHSGLGPDELAHTIGHEFGGHAAVNIMQAAGAKGGALYDGMIGAAKDALMPRGRPSPEFARFIDRYNRAFDPTGQKRRLDPTNPEALKEFIAETAGHIMAKRGAGELAIPQNIQDRISQGIGRFMGGMLGMDTREIGGDTNFGRKEVGAVTQAVQDTLGQVVGMKLRGGAEIPEAPKTDTTRIAELNEILSRPRPPAGSPVEAVRQWRTDQRTAQRELDELAPAQTPAFPAAGQPPVPPSSPVAPTPAPTPSRARVAAALRMNGIPAAEAQQWAQSAQGASVDEMVLDALKRRGAQKFPNQTPSVEPIPSQSEVLPRAANVLPEIQPVTTNEQTPPVDNGALSTGGVGVQEGNGAGMAPLKPVEVQTQDLDRIAAQAREEFLKDKALAKSGKNKGQHTGENQKAADKAAFDAAAAAHAETVPENYQGLRQRTDAFGRTSVSGSVDPSRPFDAWLIKQAKDSGHLTDESLKTLLALQDSIGKTISYDYGHAPVSDEGDMPTGKGRAAQQAEHTVAKRLSGESPTQTERKTSLPLRVEFNPGTKSFTVYGVSQEKLLNNFNHLTEKMGDLGIKPPFSNINDPRFVAAFKTIIRNQEHGWTGDGKSESIGTDEFPNTPDPEWKDSPERTIVPDDQFQFINAILADEGAKAPLRGSTTVAKAKAHLANENRRLIDEAGETNPLRKQINDATPQAGGKSWTKTTLEDPLNESISPALTSNIGEASQSDESIRVHGKVGDLSRFFDKGQTPDRAKTAAGFMPDTAGAENASESIKNRAAELWKTKGTDSPFFQKWFGESKAVGRDGKPLTLFTGQPRGLTEIPETTRNELPLAHSFLSDDRSVAGKYSGASERGGDTDFSTGRKGRTYRVYAKIENPIDLDAPIDAEEWEKRLTPTDEVESKIEDGKSRKQAQREVLAESLGLEEKWDDGYDGEPSRMDGYELRDSGDYFPKNFDIDDVIDAKWKALRGQGFHLQDALNDSPTGKAFVLFPEIGEEIAEEGDHDGYVHTDTENGGKTWIPFDASQIKSATGNQGTFDPENPDIRFLPDTGQKNAKERAQERIAARGKTNADTPAPAGETPPVGQGPSAGQRNPLLSDGTSQNDTWNTPEFKQWFEDSKTTKHDGIPMIFWHGRMQKFDPSQLTSNISERPVWWTDDKAMAKRYARGSYDPQPRPSKSLTSAFLKIKNPFIYEYSSQVHDFLKKSLPDDFGDDYFDDDEKGKNALDSSVVRESLKRLGFDGAIYLKDDATGEGDYHKSWIVFDPKKQIKVTTPIPSRDATGAVGNVKFRFMPDTGTPAEGQSPGERLMREAEAAGLAPSLETMKGVMRGDDAAFTKLRQMIKDKTGSPAKFMPRETLGAEDAAAKVGEFDRNDPDTWPKDIGTGVEKPDEYQSSWLWALIPKEKAQMRNEVRENPDGFDLTRFQTKAKQEFARRQSEAQMRAQSLKKQVEKSKFFFMPAETMRDDIADKAGWLDQESKSRGKATGKSKMPVDETAPKKNFMEAARQRLAMAR